MEVNNISRQSLTNQTNVMNQQLESVATGLKIKSAADDAAGLFISENLKVDQSELSQSVRNLNEGIAMTRIADGAISEQKNILEQIRVKTLDAMNATTSSDAKDAIKQNIENLVSQFNNIAESTNFNGQQLLTTEDGNDQINITTNTDSYTMEVGNTPDIANTLSGFLENFTNEDMQSILNAVDSGIDTLSQYAAEYGTTANQMESAARNAITEEINIANANSQLKDVDYGKEVTDFNKTNLMTQMGYLVAAQANTVQEQSYKLLT
jgi:flagellin